jgi:parvulin-like peptidyl-prolyl isomerase
VQKQIEFHKENILAGAEFQLLMDTAKIDDAAAHQYFDEHKADYQEIQARHILIRFKGSPVPLKEGGKELTEEEALAKAQEVIKRIKGGEDFQAIAKADSADTGSGAMGGELGSFKRGQMVKPFEDAAFALQPGQTSEPVKTQFGYHIIQTEKIVNKTFEEARPDIDKKLRPDAAKKSIDDLQKKANVTLDDDFFGPKPAAPPTLGSAK